MQAKHALVLLFASILVTLLGLTSWASIQQPVWQWQGLIVEPDRWWAIATLADAYFGFITFFVWVCYKQRSAVARSVWFVAIMLLGNMAMAAYVLLQIARLSPGESLSSIVTTRT